MASSATHSLARFLGACVALLLLLLAFPAAASDQALAEALAKEGEKLASEKQLDAACGKFAESLRLNRIAKVAYNLALCNKLRGKPATAWAQFVEAQRIAKIEGDQVALATAQKQADELKPRLAHVLVRISGPVEGLAVRLDEQQISKEAWGFGVPVDPGDHTLFAEAPGHEKVSLPIAAVKEAETREVVVPALQALTKAPDPAKPAEAALEPQPNAPSDPKVARPSDEKPATPRPAPARVLPWVVGGAGAALVLGGLGAGLVAKLHYDDAKGQCREGTRECPSTALEKEGTARTWANVSTAVTAVGAAGVAAGIVLFVTAPPRSTGSGRKAPRVLPVVSQHDLGLVWAESF